MASMSSRLRFTDADLFHGREIPGIATNLNRHHTRHFRPPPGRAAGRSWLRRGRVVFVPSSDYSPAPLERHIGESTGTQLPALCVFGGTRARPGAAPSLHFLDSRHLVRLNLLSEYRRTRCGLTGKKRRSCSPG